MAATKKATKKRSAVGTARAGAGRVGEWCPCARCGRAFARGNVGFVCEHFVEERLRSYVAGDDGADAFPRTRCTMCAAGDEPGDLVVLCRPCWELLRARNVPVTDEAQGRAGYVLAPRESVLAVLGEGATPFCAIERGGEVKLGFSKIPTTNDRWFERMWVRVTGDGEGVLDNVPTIITSLVHEAPVRFAVGNVLRSSLNEPLVAQPNGWEPPPLREPDDDDDRELLADVRKYGYHVVPVEPQDEGGPPFSYTVGLFRCFGHPELIVRGLEHQTAYQVLKRLGNGARAGRCSPAGRGDLLHEVPCSLAEFPRALYSDYLGYAIWFHQGPSFPTLELLWQD